MIYQIKLTLEGAKPPIWRRIEIYEDTTLADLHKIIQSTMGWMNGHLHHFITYHEYYTPPSEFDDFGINYQGMKIKQLLSAKGHKIRYEYDFGDSWLHQLELEAIKEAESTIKYPRCIKGKRACPPEDCGGVWRYMELIEIMKNPKDIKKEYEVWLRKLEPEKFDLDRINDKLSRKNYGAWDNPF